MEANEKLVDLHQAEIIEAAFNNTLVKSQRHALLTQDVAVKFAQFMDTKEGQDMQLQFLFDGDGIVDSLTKCFNQFITNHYKPNN